MKTTKVRVSPSLRDYWQMMQQYVNDLREEKLRITARAKMNVEPFTDQANIDRSEKAGLLTPPRIEALVTDFYMGDEGEIEGIINMATSDLFGIASIAVTLRDETGKLLEKGQAVPEEDCLGCWAYLPDLVPAVGTTLIVRAVATDALGGMHILEEKLNLTEEYLQTTADNLEQFHNRSNPAGFVLGDG